jgi:hypothetical protein
MVLSIMAYSLSASLASISNSFFHTQLGRRGQEASSRRPSGDRAAHPLRSVKGDARYVSAITGSVEGPVILAGHSCDGTVISNAASGHQNVTALVFVSTCAPEAGETVVQLAGNLPGSTLGSTLTTPIVLPNRGRGPYIDQGKFRMQFASFRVCHEADGSWPTADRAGRTR